MWGGALTANTKVNITLSVIPFLLILMFLIDTKVNKSVQSRAELALAIKEIRDSLKDEVRALELEDTDLKSQLDMLKETLRTSLASKALLQWALGIRGKKVFSQNDEDGAIESVFKYIGTTDKVYVEFGVEDCKECNSRYLRERLGWDRKNSLLMDGGHSNPEINLQQVIFWPDNIISLFEKFKVKKQFDFLSVDVDSYDFFMLETILQGGYKPRVIMVEYNANFELNEAKSITKPEKGQSWKRWDATTYQGMSLLAAKYLMERFFYSVVWCNKVNCMGVLDSVLGGNVRLDLKHLYKGRLDQHKCDTQAREMAIIGENGKWTGQTDGGQGSPHIRC